MIDVPGDLVWDLPCVQQASYLEGGPLMWMLPLYLHVNQKSDYDMMMLKHENLTIGNKILWKRGEIRSNFSSFPQYFQYISNFRSQITYMSTFVKCDCSIHFFLKSANLICWGTDISKYFRESLGIRDNEGWLYHVSSYTYCKNYLRWQILVSCETRNLDKSF